MIFEITRLVRKPDSQLEEQQRIIQAASLASVLTWLAGTNLTGVEKVRVELSKITSIDTVP